MLTGMFSGTDMGLDGQYGQQQAYMFLTRLCQNQHLAATPAVYIWCGDAAACRYAFSFVSLYGFHRLKDFDICMHGYYEMSLIAAIACTHVKDRHLTALLPDMLCA